MNTCIVYMYVYKHIMVGLHRLLRLLGYNPSFPYRYTLFLKYQQLPRDVFNRDKPELAVTVSYWTITTCDKYNLTLKSLPHMISIFFFFKDSKSLKRFQMNFMGDIKQCISARRSIQAEKMKISNQNHEVWYSWFIDFSCFFFFLSLRKIEDN